jgi:hypothetical protein
VVSCYKKRKDCLEEMSTPKPTQHAGIVSVTCNKEYIFLVKQGTKGVIQDVEAFKWPVENMKLKFAKGELSEIHGILYDHLNKLCNSVPEPSESDE